MKIDPTISFELSTVASLVVLLILFVLIVYLYRYSNRWDYVPFGRLNKAFSLSSDVGEEPEEADIVFADPISIQEENRRSSKYGIGEAIGVGNLNSRYNADIGNRNESSPLLIQAGHVDTNGKNVLTDKSNNHHISHSYNTYWSQHSHDQNGKQIKKTKMNDLLPVPVVPIVESNEGKIRRGSLRSIESNLSLD